MTQTAIRSRIYWRRWNLDYTKRVLRDAPQSGIARALMSCWSARVQRALRGRFLAA